MWNRIADLWCRQMHREAMWPIHGKYVCKRCLREYPVEWEGRFILTGDSNVGTESTALLADHR